MSYEDSRQGGYSGGGGGYGQGGGGGGGGYGQGGRDEREYGGGGSGGDNYYDQNKQYNDDPRRNEGRQGEQQYGGGGQQYGGGGQQYGGGGQQYGGGGQQYGGGGGHQSSGGYGGGSDEFSGAAQHASSHAGDSGDSDLFSTALGFLSGNKSKIQNENVDEDDAVNQHQKFYGSGESPQKASSNNVGAAAAMQALKMFTGGSSQEAQGGAGQSKFIGLAMAQAAKLFDQQASQGNTHPDATKQDAVAQAAKMALKLYMKGGTGSAGGGSSGGGLMNLASKFLQ